MEWKVIIPPNLCGAPASEVARETLAIMSSILLDMANRCENQRIALARTKRDERDYQMRETAFRDAASLFRSIKVEEPT